MRPPDVEPHEPLIHEELPPLEQPEPVAAPDEDLAATGEEDAPPQAEEAAPDPDDPPRADDVATEAPLAEEPEPEETAPPAEEADEPVDDLAARRAEAAAEARALRDNAPEVDAPAPSEDVTHQPTMEYTPFQTDEHRVPEAPLGEPRDDEPRLVAARGVAYASTRTETAEHEVHHHEEEVEPVPREPRPLRSAPERPTDNPRRRAAPNQPRRRRTHKPIGARRSGAAHWGRRIFGVLATVFILAVLYGAYKTFQPFHGDPSGSVAVTIPPNSDAGDVGKLLAAAGVVDSARFFELNATISGDRGDLRSGKYTLQKGMTNGAAVAALTKAPEGRKAVETVDVTLVEGPSIRENSPVVAKSEKVEGSYAKAADTKTVLRRVRKLGAPTGTKTAEGFLFPATYKLPLHSSANELVKQQLDAFDDNVKDVSMKYAKSKKLTRYDVLIIASMIEREAQLPRERRLVSAVIYNRLRRGMTLSIDATTRYATNNWQRPIRQSELDKPGPYNTRLRRGLPPTPIGNPGLASIKAAAKPAQKSYLFYVRKPGKSGEHAFSSTDAQFQRDVDRYNASREGQ